MAYPTVNQSKELPAVNQILMSVGQAPVTTLDQTNPDVSIAYDTLVQVSKEVQAEGWTFNREYHVTMIRDVNNRISVGDNILQCALNEDTYANRSSRGVIRGFNGVRSLYDAINHTFEWSSDVTCDLLWLFDWVDIPIPIQQYITARAAKIASSRMIGDQQIYGFLTEQEQMCKAYALEYDTQQCDVSFFGFNQNGNYYNSYQPYQTLRRI